MTKPKIGSVFTARLAGGLLCAALIAAFCTAHGTGPTKATGTQEERFPYEIEPMPLPKAAKELAKLFGAPVKVSESLAPSTLAIWSPSTTPAEVRAKVASAFNAVWSLRGGVWYLEQTVQQVRAEDAADLEAKRLVIRKMLERYREQTKNAKPFDEAYATSIKNRLPAILDGIIDGNDPNRFEKLSAIMEEGPQARLVGRLLARLSEKHFLPISIGERRVYALKPNSLQAPLGFDPKEDINRFIAEQETWSRVTDAKPVKPTKFNAEFRGLATSVQPISQPIDNIYVSIGYTKEGLFQLNCMVSDPKGMFLAEGEGRSHSFDAEQRTINMALLGLDEKAKEDQKKLSQEGTYFRNLILQQGFGTKQPATIPRSFLIEAAHFTAKDPLAYSTWEFLKAEAKDRGISLVANLPDPTVRLGYGLLGFLEESDAFTRSTRYLGTLSKTEPGWIILYPRKAKLERSLYRDRAKLEQQILLRRQGAAPIEVQAAYATTLPETEEFSVFDLLIDGFAPYKLPIYNDRFFLRLYGSVSKSMREAMAKPKGILVSDLPKDIQEQIQKKVYFGNADQFQFASKTGEAFTPTWQLFERGILKEATVSMPRGIPSGTTIRTSISSREMLRTAPARTPTGFDEGELMDPEDLAQLLFEKAHPDTFSWGSDIKTYPTSGIRIFQRRQIKVIIDFKNELQLVGTLTDGQPVGSSSYSLETLPPNLKKRFFDRFNSLENGFRKNPPKPAPKKDIPPAPLEDLDAHFSTIQNKHLFR